MPEFKIGAVGSIEIVRWHIDLIDGHYRIVLDVIKVMDKEGRFIKFADPVKISPYLGRWPIKFNTNG